MYDPGFESTRSIWSKKLKSVEEKGAIYGDAGKGAFSRWQTPAL
jgi:hypothetical protein